MMLSIQKTKNFVYSIDASNSIIVTIFIHNLINYNKEYTHHKRKRKKIFNFCISHSNRLILIIGIYLLVISVSLITLIMSSLQKQNLNDVDLSYYTNTSGSIDYYIKKKLQTDNISSISKTVFKQFKWPFKSSVFNCSNLSNIKKFKYLTSGWTKKVFSFEYNGKEFALKVVNIKGTTITNCLENHPFKTCYEKATLKMYKEYIISKELCHNGIIKVLAWCVSSNYFFSDVALVTELCTPIDIIFLLRLSFSQRLKIMLDLSKLMMYLEYSPLGSVAINDYQRQQFVLCGNTLKLTDLDDLSIEEPKCNQTAQCNMHILETLLMQENHNFELKCIKNICSGYNAKQNVLNTFRHFVTLFLNITAPTALRKQVDQLIYRYKSTWHPKIIFKETQNLYLKYQQLISDRKTFKDTV